MSREERAAADRKYNEREASMTELEAKVAIIKRQTSHQAKTLGRIVRRMNGGTDEGKSGKGD